MPNQCSCDGREWGTHAPGSSGCDYPQPPEQLPVLSETPFDAERKLLMGKTLRTDYEVQVVNLLHAERSAFLRGAYDQRDQDQETVNAHRAAISGWIKLRNDTIKTVEMLTETLNKERERGAELAKVLNNCVDNSYYLPYHVTQALAAYEAKEAPDGTGD